MSNGQDSGNKVLDNVKIKSSMIKDSAMSLQFGSEKECTGMRCAIVKPLELLLEYQVRYRNYTGFLLEIVRAGLTVEQAKSQMSKPPVEDNQVVDISDCEEDETTLTASQPLPPPPIIATPPKSLTLMDKITEKASEIELKDVEELLRYLKLKDEPLYLGVDKIFKREGIDGISFMLLTVETMQPMKLRIGDQVKVKQIIQQIKENSGL